VAGGQLERLLDGLEPADLGPAPGARALSTDPLLARVLFFCSLAFGCMTVGAPADHHLELARTACAVDDGDPRRRAAADVVLALLELVRGVPPGGLTAEGMAAVHLVATAAAIALTPDVPLPEELLKA